MLRMFQKAQKKEKVDGKEQKGKRDWIFACAGRTDGRQQAKRKGRKGGRNDGEKVHGMDSPVGLCPWGCSRGGVPVELCPWSCSPPGRAYLNFSIKNTMLRLSFQAHLF